MKLKGSGTIGIGKFLKDLTWNEIHLFWMGLTAGFVAVKPKRYREPKDSLKEKLNWELNQWYYGVGWVVGYLLKVIVGGGIAVKSGLL